MLGEHNEEFAVEVLQSSDILIGVVRHCRNEPAEVFRGRAPEALSRAHQFSLEAGLGGYYEISGIDALQPVMVAKLDGTLEEINRQLEALRPKAGRWDFDLPPLSAEELAETTPAQEQISRLVDLRDALTRPQRRTAFRFS